MAEPIFNSSTPRLALPLLFAGQAQKELFVNEIASRIDALLHLAIEGERDSPPNAPVEGQSWLVGKTPQGEWDNHGGQIAAWQSGNWLFVTPFTGMRLFNKAKGQDMRWNDGWSIAAKPTLPSGGAIVDSESRAAIVGLIAALTAAGIIPNS